MFFYGYAVMIYAQVSDLCKVIAMLYPIDYHLNEVCHVAFV